MTADKPSNLVPKLRFAEFVDEPPWECPPLKKLAKRITQRNTHGADLRALTNSAEHGVVDQREYFDRDIATNTDNYYIVETGDYVYNARISSTAPVGPISKNQIGTGVMSPLYTVFRFRSDANDFFAHYFRSSHWHGYLRGVSNSGARHDRMAVTNDDLMQMPIPTPSPREQQKIADCLGSLDDLIAAEGRKLEALRQHKQGLMQKLFSQPGETVPRLRFPEFRNAADWKTKILGTQGSFLSSLTGKAAKDFDTGDAAFIPYMNVFSNAFTNTTDLRSINVADDESQSAVAKGDVFFTVSSETPEEAGMSSVLLEEIGNCYLNSFCALFRFDEGKSPDPVFLGYLLRSATAREHLSRGAQGATRYNISRATFLSLPILIPSGPEQKKIVDCLVPLDDLIAAEGGKVDALRQHKQGLMQQLFPSLEAESR